MANMELLAFGSQVARYPRLFNPFDDERHRMKPSVSVFHQAMAPYTTGLRLPSPPPLRFQTLVIDSQLGLTLSSIR